MKQPASFYVTPFCKGCVCMEVRKKCQMHYANFSFYFQVFNGNQDSDTVVYNQINPLITTRFIRLLPLQWHHRISMRIEMFGCSGILYFVFMIPLAVIITKLNRFLMVHAKLRGWGKGRLFIYPFIS